LDFSETAMQDAEAALDRMYDCLARIAALEEGRDGPSVLSEKDREKVQSLRQRFEYAMDNDFNTAQAIGLLFDTIKVLNKGAQVLPGNKAAAEDIELLRAGGETVTDLAAIMGLLQQDSREYIKKKKQRLLGTKDITVEDIEKMIQERNQAREAKDWATSDAIRNRLLQHGIELQDGADGTTWDVRL
jgi:cysteinyl-tRNA synthetase